MLKGVGGYGENKGGGLAADPAKSLLQAEGLTWLSQGPTERTERVSKIYVRKR